MRSRVDATRWRLVQEAITVLTDNGYTFEEVRDGKASDFYILGVKGAALLSLQLHLSEFKRNFKNTQVAESLAIMARQSPIRRLGYNNQDLDIGDSQVAEGSSKYPSFSTSVNVDEDDEDSEDMEQEGENEEYSE